jgi:hypothetical protein
MKESPTIRNCDRLGEQQTPTIGGIPVPAWHAGEKSQQRRFEGILKEHCEIEPMAPQEAGECPFACETGMSALVVINQNSRKRRMPDKELSDSRLDQQRDLGLGKELSQSAQSRLAHDRVAKPVRAAHEHVPR